MDERAELYGQVTETLRKGDFEISERCLLKPSCFDIFARRQILLLLIKILANIDSMNSAYARQMMKISNMLSASPVLIGRRTRTADMEEGLVYERFGIPAISPETLEEILIRRILPLIFSSRGGYYVKIDGKLLRDIRRERKLSLGAIAEHVGVSRRTVYNYEKNIGGATFETALKLEEFLDESLAVPMNIFEVPKEIREPELWFEDALERSIMEKLSDMGLQVYPVRKAPFNALTVEKEKVMLTKVARAMLRDLWKRARLLMSISKTTKTTAFFVVDSDKTVRQTLEGVPVVGKRELEGLEDSKELLERLTEKSEL